LVVINLAHPARALSLENLTLMNCRHDNFSFKNLFEADFCVHETLGSFILLSSLITPPQKHTKCAKTAQKLKDNTAW
jgi:hypothetical protein